MPQVYCTVNLKSTIMAETEMQAFTTNAEAPGTNSRINDRLMLRLPVSTCLYNLHRIAPAGHNATINTNERIMLSEIFFSIYRARFFRAKRTIKQRISYFEKTLLLMQLFPWQYANPHIVHTYNKLLRRYAEQLFQ